MLKLNFFKGAYVWEVLLFFKKDFLFNYVHMSCVYGFVHVNVVSMAARSGHQIP